MTQSPAQLPLIVVGVDASPHAAQVLAWAAEQARSTRSRLRAVYGWTRAVVPGEPREDVDLELARDADRRMAEFLHAVPDGVPVEQVVADEPPVELLLRQAHDADLLVLGSHGLSHPSGKVIGSVTLSCLVLSPCPTVVVPVDGET